MKCVSCFPSYSFAPSRMFHHAERDGYVGLRPTARARISPVRRSNPDPVYVRASAGTSPVVACPPPVVSEVEPPAATPRGHVHQWINAFQPINRATLCKLVQRPRPFPAGQARSASRFPVTRSVLDTASDSGPRASLHRCPGKRPPISADVHFSPRCSKGAGESDAAGMALQAPSGRRHFQANRQSRSRTSEP